MKYHTLISLLILLAIFSVSFQKYENSNLKKFLSNLGLPDIPSANQFLDEQEVESGLINNDTTPDNSTDDETEEETEQETEEETEEENEEESKDEEEESKEEKTYINIKCLWVDKTDVFSLQKLQNKDKDYEKVFPYGNVIFNFCQNTKTNSSSTVLWESNITNVTKMILASGTIEGDSKNKNEWEKLNTDEDKSGLIIKLTHGEKCNSEKFHQTYMKIYCNDSVADKDFLKNVDLSEFYDKNYPCKHYISAQSIYGCALNDMYLLRRIMEERKIFFVIGLIAIGLFLCLWGEKCQTPTILIVFGIVFCYIITLVALNLLPFLIKTEKHLWMLLGGGFLVGGFIGYLIKAKVTIFTVFLGGSMGYSVAEVVYQFIQGFITSWNPQYLYWAVVIICVLAGVVFGLFLIKAIVILGTSLVGGYIAMRGVALIFGNYINEREFVDLIKNQEYEQLKELKSGWVYAYLGLWLLLTIGGIYYQCIGHKKSSKDNEYKKINSN